MKKVISLKKLSKSKRGGKLTTSRNCAAIDTVKKKKNSKPKNT